MIRLVSFFFTVSAAALGGALVAIQGLMLVRGDGGNVLVLAAAALALAVGLYGLAADIRRSRAAAQAAREGRPEKPWAPPRGTPKRDAVTARAASSSPAPSAAPLPMAAGEGGAPIADILAAERARADAYWRDGVARLRAEAAEHGAGDGAVVLLDVATRSLADTLGPRQVARILSDAAARYAAEAERAPTRDAGAA